MAVYNLNFSQLPFWQRVRTAWVILRGDPTAYIQVSDTEGEELPVGLTYLGPVRPQPVSEDFIRSLENAGASEDLVKDLRADNAKRKDK